MKTKKFIKTTQYSHGMADVPEGHKKQIKIWWYGVIGTYMEMPKTHIWKYFTGSIGHKGHFCGLHLIIRVKTYPNQ